MDFVLADQQPEDLLQELADCQGHVRECEWREARSKAYFHSKEAALMVVLKKEGHPIDIAKGLVKGDEAWKEDYKEYLKHALALQAAKDAKERARVAIDLWQTCRADLRRV